MRVYIYKWRNLVYSREASVRAVRAYAPDCKIRRARVRGGLALLGGSRARDDDDASGGCAPPAHFCPFPRPPRERARVCVSVCIEPISPAPKINAAGALRRDTRGGAGKHASKREIELARAPMISAPIICIFISARQRRRRRLLRMQRASKRERERGIEWERERDWESSIES